LRIDGMSKSRQLLINCPRGTKGERDFLQSSAFRRSRGHVGNLPEYDL